MDRRHTTGVRKKRIPYHMRSVGEVFIFLIEEALRP